jgi:site-specific recombinase XerD
MDGTTLLSEAFETYLLYAEHQQGLAKTTIICYRHGLKRYRLWLMDRNVTPCNIETGLTQDLLKSYLYWLSGRGLRPRGIRSAFHPLRAICANLEANRTISCDPCKSIVLPKKDAAIRALCSDEDLRAIISACSRVPSKREAALVKCSVLIVSGCGLRCDELEHIRLSDIEWVSSAILVRRGKGNKSRRALFPEDTKQAIMEWLAIRPTAQHNWLFAFNDTKKYSDDGLRNALERTKVIAGLGGHQGIKFHSIRHRYACRLHERGCTIPDIQAALGHSDPATTFKYLHASEEGARKVVATAALTPVESPKASQAEDRGAKARHFRSVRRRN